MPSTEQTVRIYEDLAYAYDRQGQAKLRDWFLVLAADTAFLAGWEDESERLRVQLLSYNPHHLLKPFTSFAEAVKSPDIQSYIADLKHSYPPERAEELLSSQKPANSMSGVGRGTGQQKPKEKKSDPIENDFLGAETLTQPSSDPFGFGNSGRSTGGTATIPRTTPPKKEVKPAPAAQAPTKPNPLPQPTPRKTPPPQPKKPQSQTEWGNNRRLVPKKGERPPQPTEEPNESNPVSWWVSAILYVVVAAAGLALVVYSLGKPFMPTEWFS